MKKTLLLFIVGALGLSLTLVDSNFRVEKSSKGVTLKKELEESQYQFFFIPTVTEDFKLILDKAQDWQKKNSSVRKDFVKEIGKINIYPSANHYKLFSSSNYNHKAKFEFQGTSDGGCNVIISNNNGRNDVFNSFHTISGAELKQFVDKCGLRSVPCEIDKIFE